MSEHPPSPIPVLAPDDVMPQMLSVLAAHCKAAGHGAMGKIEATLGMRPGYLSQLRYRGSIRIPVLIRVLDALGIDRTAFMEEVLGPPADPVTRLVTATTSTPEPPRVEALAERVRSMAFSRTGNGVLLDDLERRLERADRARATRPRAVEAVAARLIDRALDRGPGAVPLAVRALATWSSCRRILGALGDAHHGFRTALEIADRLGDPDLHSDLLERAIALAEDRGLYTDALAIAEHLVLRRATAGDVPGIGRAGVERGRMLGHLARHEAAIQCLEGALRLLPEDETANRFAAHQCLGCIALAAGRIDLARRQADQARQLPADRRLAAGLAWLDAAIIGHSDNPLSHGGALDDGDALRHYRRALRALAAVPEPLNTALVQVAMVRFHWQRSDHRQALHLAKSLVVHLDGLRAHTAAAEAVMEVVAAARLGRLETSLLDDAEAAIARGLPRRERA